MIVEEKQFAWRIRQAWHREINKSPRLSPSEVATNLLQAFAAKWQRHHATTWQATDEATAGLEPGRGDATRILQYGQLA